MLTKENIKIHYSSIRKESDDQYLFISKQGTLLKINSLGKVILELCDGSRNIFDIATIINNTYDVDYNSLLNDIQIFINKLEICNVVSYC